MKLYIFPSIIIVLSILLYQSIFIVDVRENAIVFQFGEAVRVIDKPGLYFKVPFIQNVQDFDKRILHVEVEAKELTAVDGKRITVDAFCKYKIINPVMFYKTLQGAGLSSGRFSSSGKQYSGANIRLNRILESAMRKVIGTSSLSDMLSNQRSEIMQQIKNLVDAESKHFGIEVVDVRILRADLPKENSDAIYRRMQSEREKEARQIRAEGMQEAAIIRSNADRESKILIAKAAKNATITKGAGDAAAAKIYNLAYSKDPEFYKFYRTMKTYYSSFNDDTSFIVSPDSKYLKMLELNK